MHAGFDPDFDDTRWTDDWAAIPIAEVPPGIYGDGYRIERRVLDVALTLIELEPHVPGLRVQVEPSRNYLTGDLLSHILGYTGPISAEEYAALASEGYLFQDYVGKSGVELSYEDVLRGKNGKKLVKIKSTEKGNKL